MTVQTSLFLAKKEPLCRLLAAEGIFMIWFFLAKGVRMIILHPSRRWQRLPLLPQI